MRASSPLPTPSRLHELSAEEQSIYRQLDPARIPQHVAIIMDGNGRWAGKRALKRFLGHQQGAESVQFVVETASRIDLPFLTLYAFSLENNLRRPKSEVNFLMKLLKTYLVGNVKRMNDNNVRMAYIGRTGDLPQEVQETMQWGLRVHRQEHRHDSYARTELRLPLGDRRRRPHHPDRSDHRSPYPRLHRRRPPRRRRARCTRRTEHLPLALHRAQPDPDLVIRTSGEQRISNFLLWQIAYSEILITDRLWPDFRGIHLLEAIADYQRRERRYGGLIESTSDEKVDTLQPVSELESEIVTELTPPELTTHR